jgi:hypothetical protein
MVSPETYGIVRLTGKFSTFFEEFPVGILYGFLVLVLVRDIHHLSAVRSPERQDKRQ